MKATAGKGELFHDPDQRWFGGTIPIFFHCVLAAFLFVFGRYHIP